MASLNRYETISDEMDSWNLGATMPPETRETVSLTNRTARFVQAARKHPILSILLSSQPDRLDREILCAYTASPRADIFRALENAKDERLAAATSASLARYSRNPIERGALAARVERRKMACLSEIELAAAIRTGRATA